MPQAQWSAKRERQYEHIKTSLRQHGESKTASRQTLRDTPAPVRGGKRSHQGAQGRTRDQLYEEARRKGIVGRSRMNKAQLERVVGR